LIVSLLSQRDCFAEVASKMRGNTRVASLVDALESFLSKLRRVGHEAGSLSPWLHPELKSLGFPAVCLETHHVRAASSAQRNKTNTADALGIAHIMRTGWFEEAHIKTEVCYRIRLFAEAAPHTRFPWHSFTLAVLVSCMMIRSYSSQQQPMFNQLSALFLY
jgi:hypothetical protein